MSYCAPPPAPGWMLHEWGLWSDCGLSSLNRSWGLSVRMYPRLSHSCHSVRSPVRRLTHVYLYHELSRPNAMSLFNCSSAQLFHMPWVTIPTHTIAPFCSIWVYPIHAFMRMAILWGNSHKECNNPSICFNNYIPPCCHHSCASHCGELQVSNQVSSLNPFPIQFKDYMNMWTHEKCKSSDIVSFISYVTKPSYFNRAEVNILYPLCNTSSYF